MSEEVREKGINNLGDGDSPFFLPLSVLWFFFFFFQLFQFIYYIKISYSQAVVQRSH